MRMIQVSIYTRENGSPEWIKYETDSVASAMGNVSKHDTISAFATYKDSGGFVFNYSNKEFRMSQRGENDTSNRIGRRRRTNQ